MLNKISMIVLAIVVCFTLTSTDSFAKSKTIRVIGNSKGVIINPAGKSDRPGFKNGKAWWKTNNTTLNNSCENENEKLRIEIEYLKAELAELRTENIKLLSAEESRLQEADQIVIAEPRKFAIYKMGLDHPNTPAAYGVYTNFFIPETEIQNLIDNMTSGTYEVKINIATPYGETIDIQTTLEAIEKDKNYYEKYIELIL